MSVVSLPLTKLARTWWILSIATSRFSRSQWWSRASTRTKCSSHQPQTDVWASRSSFWSMPPMPGKVGLVLSVWENLWSIQLVGNLEISVLCNEKNVPTQVQPMGGAKFGVSFTPSQPSDHIVSITFNNIPVNGWWEDFSQWPVNEVVCLGNPFMVDVIPSTDKPIITGPALHFSPIDQVAKLTIHNVDSENDIMAKVQGNKKLYSLLFTVIQDYILQTVTTRLCRWIWLRIFKIGQSIWSLCQKYQVGDFSQQSFSNILIGRWIQNSAQVQGWTHSGITLHHKNLRHQKDKSEGHSGGDLSGKASNFYW